MKSREVVTKDNYKQIVLKRMIILCWILLAVCFVVKIFGGNFFNIVCQNERFIKVCEYVDENVWCKIVLGFLSTFICNFLFYCSINMELKLRRLHLIILIVFCMMSVVFRTTLSSTLVNNIFNVVQYFILPFIFSNRKHIFNRKLICIISANIMVVLFQFVSIIVKGLSIFEYTTETTLIGLIFQIDIYIMLTLYYLRLNSIKEEVKMGWWTDWLWGKSPKQLEKMKAARLEKRAKLDQEVAEINAVLDKQRNENK